MPIKTLAEYDIPFLSNAAFSVAIASGIDKVLYIIPHTQHKTAAGILLYIWKSEIIACAKKEIIYGRFQDWGNSQILASELILWGSETGSGRKRIFFAQNGRH